MLGDALQTIFCSLWRYAVINQVSSRCSFVGLHRSNYVSCCRAFPHLFLELSCTPSSFLMMGAQKERLLHRAADREKSPSAVLLSANHQQHQILFSRFSMMVAESFLTSCLAGVWWQVINIWPANTPNNIWNSSHFLNSILVSPCSISSSTWKLPILHFLTSDQITAGFRPLLNSSNCVLCSYRNDSAVGFMAIEWIQLIILLSIIPHSCSILDKCTTVLDSNRNTYWTLLPLS